MHPQALLDEVLDRHAGPVGEDFEQVTQVCQEVSNVHQEGIVLGVSLGGGKGQDGGQRPSGPCGVVVLWFALVEIEVRQEGQGFDDVRQGGVLCRRICRKAGTVSGCRGD